MVIISWPLPFRDPDFFMPNNKNFMDDHQKENYGTYHIMVSIIQAFPEKSEWCLTALLNSMASQSTKSF